MYRVFTDEELQAFEIWSMWLGSNASQQPVETDVSRLMAACIDHFRDQQQGTATHQVTKLTGSDPGHTGQVLEQSVGAWFEEPTEVFMAVLADPANKWVVPGKSARSRLVTTILNGANAMARAFEAVAPNTGGKTWKQIVTDWIDHNCPIPSPPPQPSPVHALVTAIPTIAATEGSAAVPHPRRRRGLGMGVVH